MSTPAPSLPFADPTPVGLLGLAVGCAALLPVALGISVSPAAFKTAAMLCLLFGAGCQFLAGVLGLANKNLLGGTLFLTFAFNWVMNGWALFAIAGGLVPDHGVILATEACFLVVFVVLTYAFGFYSRLLFLFMLDIDALYVFKVLAGLTGTRIFALPIAALTAMLAFLALYIAFAILVNPVAGRAIFKVGAPVFHPPAAP
jgi:succinate-acetate transporter protein